MPAIILTEEQQNRLSHFLKRRQLKEIFVELLNKIKDDRDLKRGEITTAQNATYDAIVESLRKSLNEGWVTTDQIVEILDAAEVAGRQHICVFQVAEDQVDIVSTSILQPETFNNDATTLEEFWEIPLEPYTRLIHNDDSVVIMKIVAPRYYWVSNETHPSEDLIEIIKRREKERTAVVIKLDKVKRLVQIRVPIREKASKMDTTSSVYAFATKLIESQYGEAGIAWFNGLTRFPLADSFQKIIENRDDFELYTDTPENQHFKSSMSHKGAGDAVKDIRDFDQWGYAEGFARSSVRGSWTMGETPIQLRMHSEKVKTGHQMTRAICRLFFSRPCTDEQVEHVIERIKAHLP